MRPRTIYIRALSTLLLLLANLTGSTGSFTWLRLPSATPARQARRGSGQRLLRGGGQLWRVNLYYCIVKGGVKKTYFTRKTRINTVKIRIFHLLIRIQRVNYVFFTLPLTIQYIDLIRRERVRNRLASPPVLDEIKGIRTG